MQRRARGLAGFARCDPWPSEWSRPGPHDPAGTTVAGRSRITPLRTRNDLHESMVTTPCASRTAAPAAPGFPAAPTSMRSSRGCLAGSCSRHFGGTWGGGTAGERIGRESSNLSPPSPAPERRVPERPRLRPQKPSSAGSDATGRISPVRSPIRPKAAASGLAPHRGLRSSPLFARAGQPGATGSRAGGSRELDLS